MMTPPKLILSVLDQSPIAEGSTAADALRNSIELARLADRLGYHRYWVAEHHGSPSLACASPEVFIGPLAAATSRIRVGSGGVMLPHYSPVKVAESFGMLAGLFPGRIDVGLGRAAGTDAATAFALQRDRRQSAPDDFPDQLDELLAYLTGQVPADHPFARVAANLPLGPTPPEPWLLGSSPQSAIWAAERGLPYAFADFINPAGADFAADYRRRFKPSALLSAPRVAVAAWAVCADTDDEARHLASSFEMLITLLYQGRLISVPPPETARRFLADRAAGLPLLPHGRRIIAGSPTTVRTGLEALATEYAADEVLAVNILYDHEARMRSYELLAKAFDLSPAD